ncbi:MAG: hypothetical protein IKG81_09735 [Bacteroidales bacterium]|nr:hypothetical protein [Bacteroidales bacterium]
MSKSNYFKGLCVAVALLAAGLNANAQQFETSIYLNGIFPMGQFRQAYEYNPTSEISFMPMDRTTVATSAAVGLAATGRFGVWFDVGFGQLLPFVEAGLFWNGTRSSIRDIYDNNDTNIVAGDVPRTPTYLNIPIMLGLKYRYDITDIIRPFFEFGIGYDLMFITKNGYLNSNVEPYKDKWYAYKMDGKLCWSVGAGTYLGEYVSVGLYYAGLGSHHLNYTKKVTADYNAGHTEKRNIGELGLRVGFHF